MPVIEYEGRKYVLKTIQLKCLKCNTLCQTSNCYPDTAMCKCGEVRVDGGISTGATVTGNPWAYEDYSIYRTEDKPKLQLPAEVVLEKHIKVRLNMIESYERHGIPVDEIMSGR